MSGNGIPDRYILGESIRESVATRRNSDEYFLCDYMYTLETRLPVFSRTCMYISSTSAEEYAITVRKFRLYSVKFMLY